LSEVNKRPGEEKERQTSFDDDSDHVGKEQAEFRM
jgi:hypothetical protein